MTNPGALAGAAGVLETVVRSGDGTEDNRAASENQIRADRVALRLSSNWAILHDPHQWIVARARKRGTQSDWKPLGYIGGTKTTLRRVLSEMGAAIDREAQAALDGWPDSFLEWSWHG